MAPPLNQTPPESSTAVQAGAWGEAAHSVVQLLRALDPFMPVLLALMLATAAWGWQRLRKADARYGMRYGAGHRAPPAGNAVALAALLFALGVAWSWALHAGWWGIDWFDNVFAQLALAVASPPVVQISAVLADVGDVLALTLVSIAIVVWQLARGRTALAWGCALGIAINSLAVRVLKNAFERDRPAGAAEWLTSGHSYPSGHSAGALMVLGVLTWLLCHAAPPRARRWLLVVGALLIVAIGVSRVVLQVHFASDVLGGWLLAGTVLLLTTTALRWRVRA